MAVTFRRPCVCGHLRGGHEHYRGGTDCSACDCQRYAGQLEILIRLGRSRRAVVLPEVVPYGPEPYVRPTHSHGLQPSAVQLPAQPLSSPEPLPAPEAPDVPQIREPA